MKELRFPVTYDTSPEVVVDRIIRELKDNGLYRSDLFFACCFPDENRTEFYASDESQLKDIVTKSMEDGKIILVYKRDSLESSGDKYSEKEKPLASIYLTNGIIEKALWDIEFLNFME